MSLQYVRLKVLGTMTGVGHGNVEEGVPYLEVPSMKKNSPNVYEIERLRWEHFTDIPGAGFALGWSWSLTRSVRPRMAVFGMTDSMQESIYTEEKRIVDGWNGYGGADRMINGPPNEIIFSPGERPKVLYLPRLWGHLIIDQDAFARTFSWFTGVTIFYKVLTVTDVEYSKLARAYYGLQSK